MHYDLKALLVGNEVSEEIAAWMEQNNILTIQSFADRCDKQDQVGDRVVLATGIFVDYTSDATVRRKFNSVTAKVKQAWKEAIARIERTSKRAVELLPSEAIEEPLGEAAKAMMYAAFVTAYSFDLETYLRPSDQLLGKVRRGFERQSPQFYPLAKVQSAHDQAKPEEPKKYKASAEVSIVVDGVQENQLHRYRQVLLR